MRRWYVPILLTLIVAGFLIGGLNERRGHTTIRASLLSELNGVSLRKQAGAERIFRQSPVRRAFTLSTEQGTPLYGPLQVKEGPHEEILVFDQGDLAIKKFSPEGKLLARYGQGKGQGPGEFSSLSDFAADSQGRIWAVDPQNGRLTVFAPQGAVEQTIRLEKPPYRLSLSGDGGYFVTYMLTRDQIFGHFAPPQRLTGEFGTFLSEQGLNAILLDGWIVPDRGDGFVYAALYAGVLAAFGPDGQPRFYSELLDRPELPKILRDSKGLRWVDREAPVAAASLSLSPRGIHVLGVWQEGLKYRGALDTYDLKDGAYRESMRLPESCESAVMTARHLYTVGESSVTKWTLGS